jgi:hypothetical protein
VEILHPVIKKILLGAALILFVEKRQPSAFVSVPLERSNGSRFSQTNFSEVVMNGVKRVIAAVILVFIAVPALASESQLPPKANRTLIEDNLLVGLASDNPGLQRGSALMLGQIESDRGVIPLMAILHDNANENLRAAAAWALCKIGDARGVYAVKRAVRFDPSEKVRSVCAWYYDTYVKQGTFLFRESEPTAISVDGGISTLLPAAPYK